MQCTGCPGCASYRKLSGRQKQVGSSIVTKIYRIFIVPKPTDPRLSISMQPLDMNWQMSGHPGFAAAFEYPKELKLKLSLETRNCGDVIIVHCQGRIVYRDDAAALSRVVGEALPQARQLGLDLSGVG